MFINTAELQNNRHNMPKWQINVYSVHIVLTYIIWHNMAAAMKRGQRWSDKCLAFIGVFAGISSTAIKPVQCLAWIGNPSHNKF